jgi:hypothetical protein
MDIYRVEFFRMGYVLKGVMSRKLCPTGLIAGESGNTLRVQRIRTHMIIVEIRYGLQ